MTVTQIVKKYGGKRQKKAHKYAPTVYIFSDVDQARSAFFQIRMYQPQKEVNQTSNELVVQPW